MQSLTWDTHSVGLLHIFQTMDNLTLYNEINPNLVRNSLFNGKDLENETNVLVSNSENMYLQKEKEKPW